MTEWTTDASACTGRSLLFVSWCQTTPLPLTCLHGEVGGHDDKADDEVQQSEVDDVPVAAALLLHRGVGRRQQGVARHAYHHGNRQVDDVVVVQRCGRSSGFS